LIVLLLRDNVFNQITKDGDIDTNTSALNYNGLISFERSIMLYEPDTNVK